MHYEHAHVVNSVICLNLTQLRVAESDMHMLSQM